MRKLIISQHVSLDGSIEFLSQWGDPTAPDEELAEVTREQSSRSDALLVGRKTFLDMRGYWPQQTDDSTGVTKHLNQVHKYVVSSSLTDPEWENSTVLGRDWLSKVRAMKSTEGREIVVTGSIELCHAIIEAELVDEYRLMVYPAVQGGGRRLFPEGHQPLMLRQIESRRFKSGVVLLSYAHQ